MKKIFILLAFISLVSIQFSAFFAAHEAWHEHDAEDCGICKVIFIASSARKSCVNFFPGSFFALLVAYFALQNKRIQFLLLEKKSLVSLKVKFLN